MAYNLGSVWLQVIPSFDGLQTAARAQGVLAARAFNQGFDSEENAADARRMARAAERGRAGGSRSGLRARGPVDGEVGDVPGGGRVEVRFDGFDGCGHVRGLSDGGQFFFLRG